MMWTFLDCGKQHYWEVTSEITSPQYPDHYGNNHHCVYYIHNPFNQLMTIIFQTFSLEYEVNCVYDNLTVGRPLYLSRLDSYYKR